MLMHATVHRLVHAAIKDAPIPDNPRTGEIGLHDSAFTIWEKDVNQASLKIEVFEPLLRMLRRRGWTIGVDTKIQKHHRILSKWHRQGRHGDLEVKLGISGRCLEVKFFQNVANVENRYGGEHDFDKLERMPYLLRQQAIATMAAAIAHLVKRHGYTLAALRRDPMDVRKGGLTAEDYIKASYAECWHSDKTLGRPVCTASYNAKSADGGTIEHGMKVWASDAKGRWMPGVAYYNLNSMWWVVFGAHQLRNLSCSEIRIGKPAGLKAKDNSRIRRQRLEGEMTRAVRSMDFARAQTLKTILFGEEPLYRVWAKDKNAWYRPDCRGYTNDVVSAGLYREDELDSRRLRGSTGLKIIPVNAAAAAA